MSIGTAIVICCEFAALGAWIALAMNEQKVKVWEDRQLARLRSRICRRSRRVKRILCAALARDGIFATWGARK